MNETLKPYIEKLLSSGAKTVEEAAKFIETQTPELASEIVRWGAISESAAPLSFMLLMFICVTFHFILLKAEWCIKGTLDERNGDPPVWPFNLAVFVFFFVCFAVQIIDVLYPLIAPRLYILEKISSLVK